MIKAKKSLGQNFLKSKDILSKIVDAGDIKKTDTILEIGPGKGALTELLLTKARKVIAVEKDRRLISFLEEKFSNEIKAGKFLLVEEDILNFNTKDLKKYKVIANIPYYITGKIIPHFLTSKKQPTLMVLLVQKEVAERIEAKKERESILSLSVKAFCHAEKLFIVDRKNFSPIPNVDSAVIKLSDISKKFFNGEEKTEKDFFRLVKIGFSSKRKKLTNNLKPYFGNQEKVREQMNICGINPSARPENLTLGEWKCLQKN